ncbi:MAG: nuclear transport factor 2 family protein [Vicinamibacterales bacterium]
MRRALLFLFLALCTTPSWAQPADAGLRSELESIHAKWYQAFDSGDGATLNELEVNNVALVAPVGVVWVKSRPRAAHEPIGVPGTRHVLSDVTVRRFGDTAILTGIHTSTSPTETSRVATTVVFVRVSGKWKIASAQWTPITAK